MLQTTTDLSLVQSLAQGSDTEKNQALATLEDRHFEYCFDYLVRFGVEDVRAREVLHIILNQLKHDPQNYQGGEDFRAWYKDKALKMARAKKEGADTSPVKKIVLIAGLVIIVVTVIILIHKFS